MTMTTQEAVTALSASCLPCELAAAQQDMEVPQSEDTQPWEGVLTYEGKNTGDGRVIQPNALRWDTLPIPLRWVQSDAGGHDGAVVVGRINSIERREDGAIYALGDFDMGSEAGREAARQVEKGLTSGVSVDLDDVSFEVRVASEAAEYMDGDVEMAAEEPDENGRVKVATQKPDDELMITTDGRIRAATLLAIPAFEPARIGLVASGVFDESKHIRVPKGTPDIGGQFLNKPEFLLESLFKTPMTSVAEGHVEAARRKLEKASQVRYTDSIEHNKLLDEADQNLNDLLTHGGKLGSNDKAIRNKIGKVREDIATVKSIDWGDAPEPESDPEAKSDTSPRPIPDGPAAATILDRTQLSDDQLKEKSYEEIRSLYEKVSDSNSSARAAGTPDTEMEKYEERIVAIMAGKSPNDELGADSEEFNWVEDTGTGHLPQYIKRIAKHLEEGGMTQGHAIATAVNAVKKMCATGDINFPGKQQVNVGSQAEACTAVAEWEAKKAAAHADAAETITAGAFPTQPPAEWFSDPALDGPTPLKVTPEGRVYGHLAVWGTCHTAFPGQCVTPPSSNSGYAYFKTGSVLTQDGSEVPTGIITMDTLHAGKNLSAASTLAHYENTGRGIADVSAGQDAYGIWISGALRPSATEEQVRALRGSPLSGDWRRISGSLELVAALAVNVPGFPIPRPQGLVAGGAMQSLVASGMLAPQLETRKSRRVQRKSLSEEDYAYLKRLADRERELAESELAQMAREVQVSELARSLGVW